MRTSITIIVCALIALGIYVERDRLAPVLPRWAAALIKPDAVQSNGSDQSGAGKPAGGAGRAKPPATVAVAEAKTGALPILRETIGTVVPLASTALGTPTSGTVAEVHAKDGARVKTGDLLAKLDDRTIRAAIERDQAGMGKDQATLNNALSSLQRTQNLAKTGVATKQAADDAQAAVTIARAAVAADQAVIDGDQVALAQTEIRAPFDGKLGAVTLSPGAYVGPGTSVVTITQMKPVYAEFNLPETDLDLVRASFNGRSLSVEVTPVLAAKDRRPATGPIVFIDNSVDQLSATFKLRARLDNDDEALWPGQSLRVVVKAGEKSDLVLVPNVAVQPQDEGSVAYVVKPDKTVELRKVNVALRDSHTAGIDQGLTAGELVVTEGQGTLVDGATVKVAENGKAPAAPVEQPKASKATLVGQGSAAPAGDAAAVTKAAAP